LGRLTLSFAKPQAVRTVLSHFADKLFRSFKGMAPEGFLADASEFDRRGFSVIAPVSNLTYALTTGAQEVHTNILTEAGVEVRRV
jgi:hypothetical protein